MSVRHAAVLAALALVVALIAFRPVVASPQPLGLDSLAPLAQRSQPESLAASQTFIAQADSWVDQGNAAANMGGDSMLNVGRADRQVAVFNLQTLVKFDISKLPSGAVVSKATLELGQLRADGPSPFLIFADALSGPWDEATVTWRSMPTAVNLGDPPAAAGLATGPVDWDVTKIVNSWLTGANNGILLRGNGDTLGMHTFWSREGQIRPQLIVEYTLPATATPTPTATPAVVAPDLGDAPDSINSFGAIMDAYPGVKAEFPTVFDRKAAPHGPRHLNNPLLFHLGQKITAEQQADTGPDADGINNIIPRTNSPDHDGGDDGLVLPSTFGNCQPVELHYIVTVRPGAPRQAFVNLWADWTRNGLWGDVPKCPTGAPIPEWAVPNHAIVLPGPGVYNLVMPAFVAYNPDPTKDLWLRITISGSPAPAADGSGPAASYTYGETEDYLLKGVPAPTRTPAPTWTPIPSATPSPGPTPTVQPPVLAIAYLPIDPILVAVAVKPDLSIYGIEITEGIQCFDTSKGLGSCPDNSVPLVTRKDATARMYIRYSGISTSMSNVRVRLHIFANSVEYIADAMGNAVKTLNQANNDDARVYFNVDFNSNVPVSFYAEVDPNHTIAETNEGNNRYPPAGTITLNFLRGRNQLSIVGQRLHYHPAGYPGIQNAAGWAVNGGAANWWEQVLPIRTNGINYSLSSGLLDWTTSLVGGDGQHALISTLNTQWILQNALSWWFGTGGLTGARHVYGWAPSAGFSGGHADMPIYPHAGGLGVVGIGSDAPGSSSDNPGSGALIFGHELTHDYNVYHTNTADACGSNDNNSNFPYGSSSIQEFGFNPITGKVYDPATTHDLMSYCPSGGSKQGWISPFTWSAMIGKLGTAAASAQSADSAPGAFQATQSTESLVVNATLFNPQVPNDGGGKLGKLDDLYRIGTGVAYALPSGDYEIQLRYGASILARETFTVSFQSEYSAHPGPGDPPGDPNPSPEAGVSFIMPWAEGTTSVALVHQDQLLDERTVSAHAPTVQITSPTAPAAWPAGSTQTLSWQGADQDGNSLSYAVMYSHDGGASWQTLGNTLTSTTQSLAVDTLAGGTDVRFRVVATDGINTGLAETPAGITIPNKAPIALITDPPSDGVFAPGQLVVLKGTATDLEDGGLPGEALHWSSNRQGGLGTGPTVALNTLQRGRHIITLTAADSNGQPASATVEILIGFRSYLPAISK